MRLRVRLGLRARVRVRVRLRVRLRVRVCVRGVHITGVLSTAITRSDPLLGLVLVLVFEGEG